MNEKRQMVPLKNSLHEEVKRVKDETGISITKIVEFAIKEYLDAREQSEAMDRR